MFLCIFLKEAVVANCIIFFFNLCEFLVMFPSPMHFSQIMRCSSTNVSHIFLQKTNLCESGELLYGILCFYVALLSIRRR